MPQLDFLPVLADATRDLDVGLVVSNAGTGNPGEFLKLDRQLLQATLRLGTMAHLGIAHHFGAKLTERRRGGIILAGAMSAENGVPCMANDGAAKVYRLKGSATSAPYSALRRQKSRCCRRILKSLAIESWTIAEST
jgi:hypothetical protein